MLDICGNVYIDRSTTGSTTILREVVCVCWESQCLRLCVFFVCVSSVPNSLRAPEMKCHGPLLRCKSHEFDRLEMFT